MSARLLASDGIDAVVIKFFDTASAIGGRTAVITVVVDGSLPSSDVLAEVLSDSSRTEWYSFASQVVRSATRAAP